MKHRKCWSKSLGERGRRIRLYEKYPGGPIMRSVFVNGKEARKSLGHRDKEKAIRQGYELVHALLANENALDEQSLTLGLLMDLYLESPAHLSKKARTQHDEGRMLRRVVEFFGRTRNVDALLAKTFRMPWPNHTVGVRIEAYNVLNTVKFGFPVNDITNANFGKLLGQANSYGPRVVQLVLRYRY